MKLSCAFVALVNKVVLPLVILLRWLFKATNTEDHSCLYIINGFMQGSDYVMVILFVESERLLYALFWLILLLVHNCCNVECRKLFWLLFYTLYYRITKVSICSCKDTSVHHQYLSVCCVTCYKQLMFILLLPFRPRTFSIDNNAQKHNSRRDK